MLSLAPLAPIPILEENEPWMPVPQPPSPVTMPLSLPVGACFCPLVLPNRLSRQSRPLSSSLPRGRCAGNSTDELRKGQVWTQPRSQSEIWREVTEKTATFSRIYLTVSLPLDDAVAPEAKLVHAQLVPKKRPTEALDGGLSFHEVMNFAGYSKLAFEALGTLHQARGLPLFPEVPFGQARAGACFQGIRMTHIWGHTPYLIKRTPAKLSEKLSGRFLLLLLLTIIFFFSGF